MSDSSNECRHTCACGADIRTSETEGGAFQHLYNIDFHLRGPPHNMAEPKKVKKTKSGAVVYTDVYSSAQVLIQVDNS